MSSPIRIPRQTRLIALTFAAACAVAVTLLTVGPIKTVRAGNTWEVSLDYHNSNCTSDDLRCGTLKQAVAAADSGDRIRILKGRFDAEIDILIEDKDLTIIGAGQPHIITLPHGNGTMVDETSGTIITGYNKCPTCDTLTSLGRVLHIKNSTVSISGMWIEGSNSHGGNGGTVLNEGGTLTFSDVKIIGDSDGGNGGAVYNGQGTISLTDCSIFGISGSFQFSGPVGGNGGGIYNDRGTLHITRCSVGGDIGHSEFRDAANGGGLFNKGGTVTITNSAIENSLIGVASDGNMPGTTPNRAGFNGGNGGGIFNEYPGKVTITDSEIRSNTAGHGGTGGDGAVLATGSAHPGGNGGAGGGIYNEGEMEIVGCTIAGNQTGSGGGGGDSSSSPGSGSDGGVGGGIYNGGTMTIENSTVSDNKTGDGGRGGTGLTEATSGGNGGRGGRGGGIYSQNTLKMTNITVTSNTTGEGGKGGTGGTVASNGGTGASGSGGGVISFTTGTGNLTGTTQNTIIAGNTTASGGSGPDVLGTFVSAGHNLVGVVLPGLNDNDEVNFSAAGDQKGSSDAPLNAKLGPRQLNGGPTSTFDLQDGSPAINAGDDSVTASPSNLKNDQRGLGYIRKYNGHVDIGAIEKQPPSHPPVAVCKSSDVSAQTSCQYTLSTSDVDGGSSDEDLGDTITLTLDKSGPFGLGTHSVTLTVSDDRGLSSSCTAEVTVVDDVPPTVTAPPGRLFQTGPSDTRGGVTLSNLDSSLGTATASDNCSVISLIRSGVPSGNFFPIGTTTLTYTATDAKGQSTAATQQVIVVDNTVPTISGASADPSVLWPANGKTVDVFVAYGAGDNSGTVTTGLSITSNEQTVAGDMLVLDKHHVRLRATRAGGGSGRIYTIVITATDPYGNSSQRTVKVTVPHDQR